MLDSIRHRRPCSNRPSRWLWLAIAALAPAFVSAQAPPAQPAPASHPKQPNAAQPAPAASPAPDWPINNQPKPAAVTWNKQQLSIDATNSSLQQILSNVASATGASVEGVTKDERIFGTFGPAPARDVLTQLLQGTGYNIVMVGDRGQGVPRQVLLSLRNEKSPLGVPRSASEENDEDSAPEVQYEPPPPPQPPQQEPTAPMRPGFNPGLNPQLPGQHPELPQQPNPQQN
jgi:hypothetical protein